MITICSFGSILNMIKLLFAPISPLLQAFKKKLNKLLIHALLLTIYKEFRIVTLLVCHCLCSWPHVCHVTLCLLNEWPGPCCLMISRLFSSSERFKFCCHVKDFLSISPADHNAFIWPIFKYLNIRNLKGGNV